MTLSEEKIVEYFTQRYSTDQIDSEEELQEWFMTARQEARKDSGGRKGTGKGHNKYVVFGGEAKKQRNLLNIIDRIESNPGRFSQFRDSIGRIRESQRLIREESTRVIREEPRSNIIEKQIQDINKADTYQKSVDEFRDTSQLFGKVAQDDWIKAMEKAKEQRDLMAKRRRFM